MLITTLTRDWGSVTFRVLLYNEDESERGDDERSTPLHQMWLFKKLIGHRQHDCCPQYFLAFESLQNSNRFSRGLIPL